jgi:hypothetical protein
MSKVAAVNQFGEGDMSLAGNGAIIVLVPDTPINFQNDVSLTNEN